MAYFHLLLSFKNEPNDVRCILTDLSERELKNQFIRPYKRGSTMLAGTEVIDTMDIHSITIIKTDCTNDQERNEIYESSRKHIDDMNRQGGLVFLGPPQGYEPEDIVEAGEDVTKKYITSPPGHDKGLLSAAFNHPWIIAIVTSVVAAGIVKVFGWV